MLVNALSGEWGSGEWTTENGTGFWVKQGQMWQAKIVIDPYIGGFVSLPFRLKDSIVKAYDLSTSAATQIQRFYDDASAVSFNSYAGKKMMIIVEPTKIVKE